MPVGVTPRRTEVREWRVVELSCGVVVLLGLAVVLIVWDCLRTDLGKRVERTAVALVLANDREAQFGFVHDNHHHPARVRRVCSVWAQVGPLGTFVAGWSLWLEVPSRALIVIEMFLLECL